RDAVVARQRRITLCHRVERRRVAAPEHGVLLLVLEHDHHHVREGRHGRDRLRAAHDDEHDQERERFQALSTASARRRQKCNPPTTSTSSTPIAIPPYTP